MAERRDSPVTGLIVGGVSVGLAAALALVLATKPAKAAPSEEKLDYLIELLEVLIPGIAEMVVGQATLNQLLQQWLALQGVEPGIEVTVSTPWEAQEPEEVFRQEVREAATTLNGDRMIRWTRGKRILFKVESSLDQAVNIQLIGNIEEDMGLASNIAGPLACAANANISIGPAWDDWHPYVGARIITGAAPTTGLLTIRSVIQE